MMCLPQRLAWLTVVLCRGSNDWSEHANCQISAVSIPFHVAAAVAVPADTRTSNTQALKLTPVWSRQPGYGPVKCCAVLKPAMLLRAVVVYLARASAQPDTSVTSRYTRERRLCDAEVHSLVAECDE